MLLIQTPDTDTIEQQMSKIERTKPYYDYLDLIYETVLIEKIIVVDGKVERVYPKDFIKAEKEIIDTINSIFE